MTEKHYLPWVKARQKQLTASVRRAWFPEVKAPGTEPVPIKMGRRESASVCSESGAGLDLRVDGLA
jgi:hypothetical protein